jgi:hypothetical protein
MGSISIFDERLVFELAVAAGNFSDSVLPVGVPPDSVQV